MLCGDGCLQEGVANEAVAFAGHEQLDNMVFLLEFPSYAKFVGITVITTI